MYHYQNRVGTDGTVVQDDSPAFGSLFYKATFTTDNSKLGVYAFETRTNVNHKYREGILRFPLRTNIPDIVDGSGNNLYDFDIEKEIIKFSLKKWI